MPSGSSGSDFDTSAAVAPEQWDASEPIFFFDQVKRSGVVFGRKDAGGGREFGASDLPPDGAGSNFGLSVVADALHLRELGVGHDVKPARVFGKPDGRANSDSRFAEGRERNVALIMDLGGDGHGPILHRSALYSLTRLPCSIPNVFAGILSHIVNAVLVGILGGSRPGDATDHEDVRSARCVGRSDAN